MCDLLPNKQENSGTCVNTLYHPCISHPYRTMQPCAARIVWAVCSARVAEKQMNVQPKFDNEKVIVTLNVSSLDQNCTVNAVIKKAPSASSLPQFDGDEADCPHPSMSQSCVVQAEFLLPSTTSSHPPPGLSLAVDTPLSSISFPATFVSTVLFLAVVCV